MAPSSNSSRASRVLIHVSEMSWTKKNTHPGKIVSTTQQVEVQVLEVDPQKRRISLGLKQTQENPWDSFLTTHPKGSVVEGPIRNITEFGLFIGLDNGIDGMVHLSDLDWQKAGDEVIKDYKKGDNVKAVVLDVDGAKERISFGVKQLAGRPGRFDGQVQEGRRRHLHRDVGRRGRYRGQDRRQRTDVVRQARRSFARPLRAAPRTLTMSATRSMRPSSPSTRRHGASRFRSRHSRSPKRSRPSRRTDRPTRAPLSATSSRRRSRSAKAPKTRASKHEIETYFEQSRRAVKSAARLTFAR